MCDDVPTIDNKIALLILQHPQEQDKTLGTARLTALHFKNATLKIGLSWASLAKALGRPADPQRWAILYLGSARAAALAPDAEIVAVNRKGEAEERQQAMLQSLEGVVLLDGTWSQAKALWWRNPWMLKCRRILLNPLAAVALRQAADESRAATGCRRSNRRRCCSAGLRSARRLKRALLASFDRLLGRYRELRKASPSFDRAQGAKPARTEELQTCKSDAQASRTFLSIVSSCERQPGRRDRLNAAQKFVSV